MRAREFLLEYNMEALLKNFGEKLMAKWREEGEPFEDQIHTDLNTGLAVGEELTPEHLVKWIERFDPTQNNKYITWIIGKYAGKKGGINRLEDMTGRMRANLETYERLSRRKALEPEHAQITKIKTLPDLEDVVDSYQEVDTASQAESGAAEEQAFYDSNGAEMIYNGDDYKIVIPKTEEASCYFGKNTRWCTASKNNSYFNSYNKDGPLYVILHKATNTRWQFHFESRQYMDERDVQINVQEFVKTHKKAMNKIISHHGDMDSIATSDPKNWYEYLKNPSEAATIAAISVFDGRLAATIENPSEAIKIAAVYKTPTMIEFFPNPSKKMIEAAIDKDPVMIKHFTNMDLDKKVIIRAIRNKPAIIQFFDDPSPEFQMWAMIASPETIKYIKNPAPVVQATYVEDGVNGMNIKNLTNPHPLAQIEAVKQNPEIIKVIKNPSPEVQLYVVQQNGLYITYIDNPTDEAQLAAVKNDPHALRHIKNPSGHAKKWLRHNTESFNFDLKELQHLSGIK